MLLKSFAVFLSVLLLSVNSGSAQVKDTLFLTLEQSLKIAQEDNKNLLQLKEKITKSQYQMDEARSGFLPTLSFDGTYTRFGVIPSFQIKIPGMPEERIETGFENNYNLGLSLTQPIFTWGKIRNSYDISILSSKATREEYKRQIQEIEFEVATSFYQLILAKELIKVREEAVDNLKEHLRTVEARFTAGQASEFELLRAKVQLSNAYPALTQAKNMLDLGTNAFKNLLGVDLKTPIELVGELSFEPIQVDPFQAEDYALKQRPEISSLNLQKKITAEALSIVRATYRPNLAGFGTFQYMNPFYGVQEWDYDWKVGLVVNMPLFDGFSTRSKIQQAKSDLAGLEILQRQVEEGIKLEVRQAISDLNLAKENIFSQEENVKQARKALEIAKVQYAEGVITSLEEMDTQLALTIAQTNYLQALSDYSIAKARYHKAIGKE
jgi:outer membrane protein TolC